MNRKYTIEINRKYTIEVFNKHAVITSNFSIDDKDYLKFKQVEDMLNSPNDYRISKRMHLKVNNDDAGFDAYFHEKPYEGHTMARIATYNNHPFCTIPKITKVIFNGPATIVFWSDDTKTVVKCDDDEFFDREKGLAMAISKKALGNKGNYYNEFRKWIDTEDQNEEPKVHIKTDYETMETVVRIDGMSNANSLENLANILNEKLRYCTYGGDHK